MKVLGLIVSIVLLAHTALAQSVGTWAGGPRVFSYQGVVLDQSGRPFSDGPHTVTIELYAERSGTTLIYEETQQVNFHNGVFDVNIGGCIQR